MLNEEQLLAYDTIYRRVTENRTGSFFLDDPGGTGKTFLYTTLLANLRARGLICLAVASSGIATANLPGGRTSNSRFKIPLDIENNQSSQISKQSPLAELIQSYKLIIWDEAPMAKRQSIEYFEKILRGVCSSTEMFGGKIVVFGGDFRQVLPIIPKSTLQKAINSSFVMSPLWHELERLHLTVNMRVMGDPAFCDFVLSVGNGSHPYENGKDFKLPRSIFISGREETTLIEQLIDTIYPDIQQLNINPSLTTKRAILIPKNDDTQMINSILVSRQEGEPFTYRSFDEATDVAMRTISKGSFLIHFSQVVVMAPPTIPLSSVTERSRNFTVVLTLESIKGTEMIATIFQEDISSFRNTLHEGHQYEIQNPIVNVIPEKFRYENQMYQMVFEKSLHIIDLDLVGVAIFVRPLRKTRNRATGDENKARDIIIADHQ
ncbi:uncharacterized protein LOC141607394 [Silene latifolia]|uniref:uncharacterized protein LOC141607394 n=1 Tax=Silene latifolia TaxID=37657 RepID=UPI003D7793DD